MSRSLWASGDFLKFWGAQASSLVGSQTTAIALPLIAIVLLHASALEVGVLASASYLPFLILGLPAGAWVDRWDRRKVLLVCDLARGLSLLAIPLAYYWGSLSFSLLFLTALVTGSFTVFFDAAHFSYLPEMVEHDQIVDGNAKLYASLSGAQLLGPALAGFLIEWLKAPFAILFDALTFFGSFALVGAISGGKLSERGAVPPSSLVEEVKRGLRFVWGHRHLRPVVLSLAVGNGFGLFGMVQAILPLLAIRGLGFSAGEYGGALALGNTGALLGVFLNTRIVARFGFGRTIALGSLLCGVGLALVPFWVEPHAFFRLVLPLSLATFGASLFNMNQMSLRQSVTPRPLLGRMNATVRFLTWGTIPLGTCAGGFLADHMGLEQAFLVAAGGALVAAVPLFLSQVRSLQLSDLRA